MKKRLVSLVFAVLAVASLSSLAMAQPWGRGMGGWMAQVPQEKQEQVAKLYAEGRKKIYDLESRKWDKQAELNVQFYSAKPDSAKIEALAKEIGTLGSMAYQERVALQQRILKETGVNLPLAGPMGGCGGGHGMGMGRGGCGPAGPQAQNSGNQDLPPCCRPGQAGAPAGSGQTGQ